MKKFLSLVLIIFLLFSIVMPIKAVSGDDLEYVQKPDFWTWIAGSGSILHEFVGHTMGKVCPNSEDGYHHASSYEDIGTLWLDGYFLCRCDFCGHQFTAYASDLQQSYENQVEEMKKGKKPTQITSSGSFIIHAYDIWDGTGEVAKRNTSNSASWEQFTTLPIGPESDNWGMILGLYGFHSSSKSIFGLFDKTYDGFGTDRRWVGFAPNLIAPVSGTYRCLECLRYTSKLEGTDGNISYKTENWNLGTFRHRSAGEVFKYSDSFMPYYEGMRAFQTLTIDFFFPYYEVIPDTAISNDTYAPATRPTSITGNYGIIGDNGQITQVTDNSSIVNETTNQFFNPATGESATISDWTYNYEDRSYTVTTETGDTVTVTYGDENITIVQGGDTYNIYYMVPGGSGTPGPDSCAHNWQETDKTEPTCVTAGKTVSTCALCGKTKTDPIPAAGHTWVVERTVQTSYDDEGNLLQQGYTIYQCSVCGEQYKDQQGTGPPGEEEEKSLWEQLGDLIGSGIGGILELAGAILGKFLDALTSLVEMITDKLKGIVEGILAIFDELPALFGGFLDFLGALFPYLPEEIMTLLTFGVIAIVFIGILKAVRR